MNPEEFIQQFEETYHLDSHLAWSLFPDEVSSFQDLILTKSKTTFDATNGLHMNNCLYMYTNPPPYGYGTPAPKVAETVLRAYEYNRKTENKTFELDGEQIESTAIADTTNFPFSTTTGNFNPYFAKLMADNYFLSYSDQIIETANKVIDWVKTTPCDILSAGNQTWDPESEKSVTNAKAYQRVMKLFQKNLNKIPSTMLEMLVMWIDLLSQDRLTINKRVVVEEIKSKYIPRRREHVRILVKKLKTRTVEIRGRDNVYKWVMKHTTGFCSYIKHGERGKKDRRAIASAGIFLRFFLKVVEEFHLQLAKIVPGNTISIGGEEKKKKILSELRGSTDIQRFTLECKLQGTEDATKWNECLNPSLFALVHRSFFDNELRIMKGIPECTNNEKLFLKICDTLFLLMSNKRIHLGPGVVIKGETFFKRKNWSEYHPSELNSQTQNWYLRILDKLVDDNYVRASPGFLMGMLNAASTTIGLLPSTFIKSPQMKVMTLRSSDDSMSIYIGSDTKALLNCILTNFTYCKLIGINMSTSKTLFCHEGYGEYTSWYQDGDFVGQAGVETASLKPGGINPQDDFNNMAIQTSVLLKTYVINVFGATARLMIGLHNIRRLWRIKKSDREGLTKKVQFLADGGISLWNLENCHIDEATIRFNHIETQEDRNYFVSIMDPDNPFSAPQEERMYFSKDKGMLVMGSEMNPTNVFTWIKRSNNTVNNQTSKLEAEIEKTCKKVHQISTEIDPSLLLSVPSSKVPLGIYLSHVLELSSMELEFSPMEMLNLKRAIGVLAGGNTDENSDDEYQPPEQRSRIDELLD